MPRFSLAFFVLFALSGNVSAQTNSYKLNQATSMVNAEYNWEVGPRLNSWLNNYTTSSNLSNMYAAQNSAVNKYWVKMTPAERTTCTTNLADMNYQIGQANSLNDDIYPVYYGGKDPSGITWEGVDPAYTAYKTAYDAGNGDAALAAAGVYVDDGHSFYQYVGFQNAYLNNAQTDSNTLAAIIAKYSN